MKFFLKLMALVMVLGVNINSMPVLAEEITEPQVEAAGAILMDCESGRVLWEKNAHKPMAMASTTKIMTATLALELGNLDDIVTVSKRASQAPDVQMNLVEGEEITLEALLYGLMMQSYNDAAIAIAEHIGGTVENFCDMMTTKAIMLGALDTVFETPNGLDTDNHYSTAYDMAKITCYAMQNPKFIEVINTPDKEVTSSRTTYSLYNRNRLLNEFEGADGVKTGFTNKAGQCFVGSAQRDGMHLISVVLASGWGKHGKEQKWVDTKRLLNYGFTAYEPTDVIEEGSEAGIVLVERSRTDELGLHYAEGIKLPLTEQEMQNVKIEVDFPESLKAPIEEGQIVGSAKIFVNNELFTIVNIKADAAVERHDLKTSLEKVFKAFLQMGTSDDVEIMLPELPKAVQNVEKELSIQ